MSLCFNIRGRRTTRVHFAAGPAEVMSGPSMHLARSAKGQDSNAEHEASQLLESLCAEPAFEIPVDDLPSVRLQFILALSIGTTSCIVAGSILLLSLWLNGFFVLRDAADISITQNTTTSELTHRDTANDNYITPETISDDIPVPRMIPPPISTKTVAAAAPVPYTLTLPDFSIQPHSICNASAVEHSTSTTRYSNDVLITIITEPEDSLMRSDYRQIWRNYLPALRGNLLFVLANSQVSSVQEALLREADQHGDLLQINAPTNTQTKYLKTLAVLNWTANHCLSFSFLVRMNVDVLIQPNSLRALLDDALLKGLDSEPVIIGDVIGDEQDDRSLHNFKFPRFVYGTFYILSRAALRPIVHACRVVKPISLEEVYVTGSCAEYGQVQRIGVAAYEMERELQLWRKMFSCLPGDVLSVSNVGKDNVLYYWYKAVRARCYLAQ